MKEIDRFERLKSKLEHTRKSLIDEGFELDGLGIMENYDVLNPYVHGYSKAVLSEFPQFETINEALCGYDLFSEFADGDLNDSNAIDWVVDKVRSACESVEEEKKDELVEAKQLNEGTSNFYGNGGADFLPLLVFMEYENVYDACVKAAKDEYATLDDEQVDWEEFRDEYVDEHFDEYGYGVRTLDEWEIEELNDDLYDMTKRINDKGSELYYSEDEDTSLRGEILKDVEFEIKPGYYEGAQIFVDLHGNEEYLNDEDKEELAQCFEELKKKHNLTEMAVAWGPASNGETGYKIVEAKEEKPQEEKKTYAIAVRYVENGDFDILTYETKEEMEDAYEKAKNSYLINGREWDDISLDVFGACEDCDESLKEHYGKQFFILQDKETKQYVCAGGGTHFLGENDDYAIRYVDDKEAKEDVELFFNKKLEDFDKLNYILQESSYANYARYEYKGGHVIETPSGFVATDEHGSTLGSASTKDGAEAIIDKHAGEYKKELGEERHMSDGPLQLGEDHCINESEENEIKAILKPRLTQDGQIKPFADDEKLPRGFRFLASTSGVNQRGYVRYKGNRYWFEVKDGEDGKDVAVIRESVYDKKPKQVGHVNTNAGDVEKNIAAFNHSMMGEGIEDDAAKTSIKNQIGDNVKDEIDAIDNYDGLIDAINFCGSISEEDKAKLLAIVDDIRSEEYKHVGQLSKAVDVVDSKAADDVAKGHEEGVEQADGAHGEEHVEDEKEEVVEIEG